MATNLPSPNTVSAITDMILTQLSTAEERRLQSVIDKLIEDNDANRGAITNVISWSNEVFWHSGVSIASGGNKKIPFNLSLHLSGRMSAFLAERDKLRTDTAQIKDLLRAMIGNTKVAQEIRDRLPECLVQFAPGWIATLPRVNEIQHELRFDRALWKRYQLIAPKIEMYAATQLLY